MKRTPFSKKNTFFAICGFIVLGTALLFGFNNCGPQGSGILGSTEQMSAVINDTILNAPFAYDVAVDTISYNSCVSETVKTSDIHGIKIGANEGYVDAGGSSAVRSGVKLRSDFLEYVGKYFKPDYPETKIGSTQIQKILSQSKLNQEAYLNLGVRSAANLTVAPDLIFPGANGAGIGGKVGRDVQVFPRLFHDGFLGYNITKGVKYTPTGGVLAEGARVWSLSDTSDAAPIEARFSYNNTEDQSFIKPTESTDPENYGYREQYAETVRTRFNSNAYILAATFGGTQDAADVYDPNGKDVNNLMRPLKSDGTIQAESKAFGKGFQLQFSPASTSQSGWKSLNNRLVRIREFNLDTGTEVGGTAWSCENYLLVPPTHWNSNVLSSANGVKKDTHWDPACMPLQADDLTPDRLARMKRLRRHYGEAQWNIGLFQPAATKGDPNYPLPRTQLPLCVSPKANDCYLPTTGILFDPAQRFSVDVGIQYDASQECYLTMSNYGSAREDKKKLGRCAQFASICVRNSTNF